MLAWYEWMGDSTRALAELGRAMISARDDMLLPRECLCLMAAPAPLGLLARGGGERTAVGVSGTSPGGTHRVGVWIEGLAYGHHFEVYN